MGKFKHATTMATWLVDETFVNQVAAVLNKEPYFAGSVVVRIIQYTNESEPKLPRKRRRAARRKRAG